MEQRQVAKIDTLDSHQHTDVVGDHGKQDRPVVTVEY